MKEGLIPPPQIHPELLQTWCLTSKTALYLSGSTKDFTVACLRSAHGGGLTSPAVADTLRWDPNTIQCWAAFTQQIKLVADSLATPGDQPA